MIKNSNLATTWTFGFRFLRRGVLIAGILALMSGFTEAASVTIGASVTGNISDIVTFNQNVNPATGQIIDGSGNPIPLSTMPFLTYGNFIVSGGNDLGATTTTVGDGINDQTWWAFDFTGDANVAAFSASTDPLVSAVLNISVAPRENPPFDERVFVPGLNGAYDLPLTGAIGQVVNVVIQLVRPELVALGQAHNAADILGRFDGSGSTGPSNVLSFGPGVLPFKFFDDAQVLSANLELTRAPVVVPLPAALPLFAGGLGLLGILGWRQRRAAA